MKYFTLIKNLLLINRSIKLFSLILGFGLWSLLSQIQIYDKSYSVPICCFGSEQKNISLPENVYITLRGSRSALKNLCKEQLAVHINTEMLHQGENMHIIGYKDLFLPSDITMVNCNPRIAKIFVESLKEA